MTEAREAWEKVAPLEKRVSDLTLESQEQSAAAERYKGEVARVEALLGEKDFALNQAQADLLGLRARWPSSIGAQRKTESRLKVRVVFYLCFFIVRTSFPNFCPSVLFFDRAGEEGGRGSLCRRCLKDVP